MPKLNGRKQCDHCGAVYCEPEEDEVCRVCNLGTMVEICEDEEDGNIIASDS